MSDGHQDTISADGTLSEDVKAELRLAARRNPESQSAPPLPRILQRIIAPKSTKQNLEQTFDLIGGVPAFALWADQNRTEFYRLYSKLLPVQLADGDGTPLRMILPEWLQPKKPEEKVVNEAVPQLELKLE